MLANENEAVVNPTEIFIEETLGTNDLMCALKFLMGVYPTYGCTLFVSFLVGNTFVLIPSDD